MITVDGRTWEVTPSGHVTQYLRDEFGLLFHRLGGDEGETRVVRYSPLGSRIPEESLAELSDHQLETLFRRSQPSWTAPETEYRR
jgi:hypothetical protein